MPRNVVAAACALLILALSAVSGSAQVHLGTDLAWRNRYVWRGVTRSNRPVLQPDIYVSFQRGKAYFTTGAWASIEYREAGGEDLSDTGLGQTGVGEFNYWVEFAGALGQLDFSLGWTEYLFDNDPDVGGRGSNFNTSEIYGSAELKFVTLAPKLAVWYDVDKVKGAYIETSATLQVPILPLASVYLTGLAGWSAGQDIDAPGEVGYFADDGLAFIDMSAWGSYVISSGWSVAGAVHLQINGDPLTRTTSAAPEDSDQNTKVWITVALSWAHAFGGLH